MGDKSVTDLFEIISIFLLGDREVTLTNVTGVMSIIFGIPIVNVNVNVADVNGNGKVSIADVNALINYQFRR